ncbi:urease accessory protein UreD [Halococcoides cellulosivorans]|uniref:Urease accessory protein UreD n=1 Tax=Halococcoides cellulosivorans TaxID=1679096 RepID=A0A2R4X0C3_9EURY|nr:urease accessory protein UreD [Halococcoides cellulosivorans]AWB27239.1 urease accessory protein UreD [Halococcoides cellulosivorans]
MAADRPGFEAYADESPPGPSVGAAGTDGRLELEFGATEGGTALVRDYARSPFHVTGTLPDPIDRATAVCVQSPAGGIAQGDRRAVDVSVGPEAVARVTTGSATKVFGMDANYATEQVRLTVERGGHLDWRPKASILKAGARLDRRLDLSVGAAASAIVGSIVVPGRLARGERYAFDRYRAAVRIEGPGGRLATDRTDLAPDEQGALTAIGGAEGIVLGDLYVVAPDGDADALSDRLHAAVDGPARAGASTLPRGAGVLVRVVAPAADPVRTAIAAAHDAARRSLLGGPA